jgi:hypothetical protein
MRQEPHVGAPAVHCGEQQEASPKSADAQLHPVDVFGAGLEGRALRVRIHRARDVAQSRAGRSKHGRARAAYWLAAQFCGDWVFQRASADDLQEVIKGISWLFLFAGLIERLEAPDEGC